MDEAVARGPLSDIRVVELCSWLTGPMTACILADQGADVIKIEPPHGDPFRFSGTARNGYGAMFLAANRNKRSIALNLKDEADKQTALELIATADVVIQNARPGAMERMGFGAEALRAMNPRLIYASISGYGQTGPLADAPAFDPLAQAISGLCKLQGDPGKPEIIRTIIVDKLIGPVVAQAISTALYRRERTGEGATIDVSMLDTMVWWMWPDAMMNETFLEDGAHRAADIAKADSICPTADGHIVVSPHQDKDWLAFTEITGRLDLRDRPDLLTTQIRMANLDSYYAAVRECLLHKTTQQWLELMRERDIPCAPVLSCADIADFPQVVWNGSLEEVEHPVAGRYRTPRQPARIDGVAAGTRRPVPGVGEHSDAILLSLREAAGSGEARPD